MPAGDRLRMRLDGLERLVGALRGRGYEVIGPRVRDGAIVLGPVSGAEDLPRGVGDSQEAGTYRLRDREDGALFGYAVGPHSFKRELLAPEEVLWTSERVDDGFVIRAPAPDTRRRAFLGVRACELAAIAVQDRVFLGEEYRDERYASRREGVFTVAVWCGAPAATCFCTSMGTGPSAGEGYDLALTEILEGEHRFLVEVGTAAGAEVAEELGLAPAGDADIAAGAAVVEEAAASLERSMDAEAVPGALSRTRESGRYRATADRCLACTNCTMVCPTCFCTGTEEVPRLDGSASDRVRRWDSCFSEEFSYIHGGSIRVEVASRYRQWITHKLSTWHDQFGTSGCVGCGRCITWCPPGIDITEEAAALVAEDRDREETQGARDP